MPTHTSRPVPPKRRFFQSPYTTLTVDNCSVVWAWLYKRLKNGGKFRKGKNPHWSNETTTLQHTQSLLCWSTLHWLHNECDGVSNHHRLRCLLNCWFKLRSNKTSNFASLALVREIHRWTPHKRPVTRKLFPFDDVIMYSGASQTNKRWHPPITGLVSNSTESPTTKKPGPCIANVFATRRKNFSQWHRSFQRKLRSHWLKFLRHVAITLVIQGPGLCGRLAKRQTRCKSCVNIATKMTKHTGITGEICYPNSICFVVISSVIPKSISETLAKTSRNLSLVIMIHTINNPIILHPSYRMFLSWFAQVGKCE